MTALCYSMCPRQQNKGERGYGLSNVSSDVDAHRKPVHDDMEEEVTLATDTVRVKETELFLDSSRRCNRCSYGCVLYTNKKESGRVQRPHYFRRW